MNKTDRMMAIVLELQRRGTLRAEDLASVFETSVRTIYRDIQALCEAGVAIIGAPGQGYSLMEGYFLPPVHFTAEEAEAILLGVDYMEQQFGRAYEDTIQAVRRKLESVMPQSVRQDTERMRSSLKLIAHSAHAEGLALLRRAVMEERSVRFRYVKPVQGDDGRREHVRKVDPYGIVHIKGTWSMVAYCHLRQAIRHFRLSRIQDLELLDESFTRPPDFSLQSYQPSDDRQLLVRVLLHAAAAERVKEQGYFFIDTMEEHPEGTLVTLRVRQPEDVLGWILGWGSAAVVLEPESLTELVRLEAEKILQQLKRY